MEINIHERLLLVVFVQFQTINSVLTYNIEFEYTFAEGDDISTMRSEGSGIPKSRKTPAQFNTKDQQTLWFSLAVTHPSTNAANVA